MYVDDLSQKELVKSQILNIQAFSEFKIEVYSKVNLEDLEHIRCGGFIDVYLKERSKCLFIPIHQKIPEQLNRIAQYPLYSKWESIISFPTGKLIHTLSMLKQEEDPVKLFSLLDYEWKDVKIKPNYKTYEVRNLQGLKFLETLLNPIYSDFSQKLESNLSLFDKVFTHKSIDEYSNYEYLEKIGDRQLKGYFSSYIDTNMYIRSPSILTDVEHYWTGNIWLSYFCKKIGLNKYLLTKDMNPSHKDTADIVEALIGALWRVYNYDVYKFIKYMYDSENLPYLTEEEILLTKNPQTTMINLLREKYPEEAIKYTKPFQKDGFMISYISVYGKVLDREKIQIVVDKDDKITKLNIDEAEKEVIKALALKVIQKISRSKNESKYRPSHNCSNRKSTTSKSR